MATQTMSPVYRKSLHVAAGADANGEEMVVQSPTGSYVAGCIQISGTVTTATIHFEGTADGTNWVAIEAVPVADSTTPVTSATAAGIWRFNCMGLYKVRARLDWTAGSIDVTGTLVA